MLKKIKLRTSIMRPITAVLIPLLSLVLGCYGDDESANHLVLFDAPPDGVSTHRAVPFDIRTNFSGNVNLVESRDFRVVVNITAPTLGQAYDVTTRFVSKVYGGMMLEVKQGEATEEFFNPTWLLVTLSALTLIVAIFTGVYAIQWYKAEHEKQEVLSEQKSYASSSHRGTMYRSRNSIQMGGLQGGDGMKMDDALRGDEELRQVREMPEEEEAEALEMEQLKKLKFKDDYDDLTAETEDSDPQEKNFTKSRLHSQAKTIHKELLKKSVTKKGPPPPPPMYKRTQLGRYEGVPTHDTDDTTDEDRETTLPLRGVSSERSLWSSSGQDLRVHLDDANRSSNGSLSTFGRKSQEKESNLRRSENDLKRSPGTPTVESDPMQLVKADVHPGGKPVMVSITPRDTASNKSNRPGNIYVPPPELKSASKLSTFGQRGNNGNASAPPSTTTTTTTTTGNSTTSANNTPPVSSSQNDAKDQKDQPKPSTTPTSGVTRQDVSRNFQENVWGSPGILSMSDIPEDPREDDHSGISGSQKSASMYGSSEIFEIPDLGNTYYNLDSDIDIPPLDSDDNLWSDGGLPSPRLWTPKTAADKGKTNDDIKLIPGALKSPGPTSGRLVVMKPRPNSSIILQSKSPGPRAKPQSPPPYEEIVHNSNIAFEFPPPPKFLQTPYDQNVSGDVIDSAGNSSGDYVVIKHDGKEAVGAAAKGSNQTPGQQQKSSKKDEESAKSNGDAKKAGGGGGGKKTLLGTNYLNMTILSTLCVLSLATTGVMCLLTSEEETRVDITVFAPAYFFTNQTRVFFNKLKDTEATELGDKAVLVYDVSDPWLDTTYWFHLPCNRTCRQGCDESRGQCVCLKGYRLTAHGDCEDVNECMEGKAKCDKAAGCYNRKGSYDCICGEDFYGDGKTCRDCQQGCPKDHYEEQPCSSDRQKICKVCQPACREGEFESRQCTNLHDRICTNMTALDIPEVSTNVMLEERSRVRSDRAELEKLPEHYVGFSRYKLHRGTDFFVEMTVRFINPTPNFLPVNLSQPFDLDNVAPSVLGSFVVQRYCPSPVPDYYIFSYKKHQNLTYKLWDNGSIEACETHKQFGQFLDGDSDSNFVGIGSMERGAKNRDSFVCAQPGSLTNNFVMDEDFFHARTKWVDKSKRCQRHSRACESCTTQCGTDMFSGVPTCAVDKEGRDDGISPRLMTCYNCCVKRNCSNHCQDYHKRRCQPEQCLKGNLLEFTLKPTWESSQDKKFFCHIQPVENQRLLEMDYNVRHASLPAPLYSSSIKLYGDDVWRKEGRMEYSDGILDVELDTGLDSIPNFVEGAINPHNTIFKVGTYKDKGTKFKSSRVNMDYVFLRPSTPTAIPHMPQAQQDCTNHDFDTMNLATNMENPYIQDTTMEGLANGSLPFSIHHKSKGPSVNVRLQKGTRLLQRLFSPTTLKPNSFRGNLYNNRSHWVVNVSAAVSQCPGYVSVQIQDPINATKNLYDMDVVIFCPTAFNMTFALMTFDEVTMFKDIMVVVRDNKAVHHFRLYHTSRIEEKLRRKESAKETVTLFDETLPYASKQIQIKSSKSKLHKDLKTPEFPIDVPYLIGIAGFAGLLLVLAILGQCFLPDIPEIQVHWYHPVFAIFYMVVQFVYSVLVSASMFFLILMVITSPYVKLINQHGQKGGVTSSSRASSRLELLQLQRHVEKEIARQDMEVDKYQMHCIHDVKKIVDDMNKMHEALLKSTADIFESHRLDLLLEEQKVFIRQKLTKELNNFREEYLTASKSIFRRIRQDAAASYQNIQHNNTWLEGARFLHKVVGLFQDAKRRKVQTFMEWTGINVDSSSLDVDLSFSLPALPRLDEIVAPPPMYKPPIKRDLKEATANEMIRSIQVHNNWFFPLADSILGAVSGYKPKQPDESLTEREEAATMFYFFIAMLLICDLVLLCHRMIKAWTTARLLLFGFPEYYRERKDDIMAMGDDDIFESKESKNKLAPVQSCRESNWVVSFKMFLTRTISTTFLPKIVGALAACVSLICILGVSNKYLTVTGLQNLGLYHNATQSVSLQISVTNGRIQDHSAHINSLEYPSFQALTNSHLNTHKTVFGFYRRQLHGLQNLTAQMYCLHLKDIGIPSNCSESKGQGLKADDLAWLQMEALTHACRFQPVIPELFHRETKKVHPPSEKQVETLLQSLRTIIYYTSHLILIFLIIIVIKELAFGTLWILLQRSGVIRMRIIVEQDQGDMSQ